MSEEKYPVVFKTFLFKRKEKMRFSTWKTRLVELKDKCLYLYKSDKSGNRLKAVIDFDKLHIKVEIREKEPTKFM